MIRLLSTLLLFFSVLLAEAQPRRADFLSLGINAGSANYTDRATSQGFGMHVSADLNINRWLFANITGTYTNYLTENNTVVFNFGIKAYPYRFIYIHPYTGFARILAEPDVVKRGTLGIGLGSSVKTGKRHLNFEACAEYLPYYNPGTYYLFGRFSFPILMGNDADDPRGR